jgi:zinc/manganese transport system permease protein
MTLSTEILGLLLPATICGLVVASIHIPLGQEVLKRGIIFIDLAVAQIAALGVVISQSIFHIEEGFIPFITALCFALSGGMLFAWLGRIAPKYQEAFIGSAFVISASLIIVLLTNNPHGGEEIHRLLSGQILWVSWKQIFSTAAIYAVMLIFWFKMQSHRELLFYTIFPIAITLSVQLVGIYLVFASLIIPALGALGFRHKLIAGYIISLLSVLGGLILSTLTDLPSGPVIVCFYAVVSVLAYSIKRNTAEFP